MQLTKYFSRLIVLFIMFGAFALSSWGACGSSNGAWTPSATAITGNVKNSDEYYTITVATSGNLNISVKNTHTGGGVRTLTATLYPDNGQCNTASLWNTTNITKNTTQSSGNIGVTAGTYTLKLISSSSSNTGYSLTGSFTPATLSISDSSVTEGDSGTKMLNFTVTLVAGTNVTVDYNTSNGTALAENDFNTTNGTLTFVSAGSKIISVPIIGDTIVESDETFTVILSNVTGGATIAKASATGTIINDDSYCQGNGLTTGFHIIDPDGGDSKNSFEIFCSADNPKKDLIALPNKNNSNNFIFNSNVLGSTNYYDQATTNATGFSAIEINPITMQVITSGILTPTTSGDGTYKIMGKGFSNINLIGSPFAIDWDNTTISGCDVTKLTRKGYYGQAVKINSLDYANKSQCQIDSMKLKLLNDYTYLVYNESEVLEKTCKEMAEAVPSNFLDSATIKGHYWISPNEKNRSYKSTSITALDRPMVAYCWYQTDLDYVWTFFLSLDGKVTKSKNDLVNKVDTCSEKGLWPFVPNNELTFERVRGFLADKKTEWVSYTGTNNEKFKSFNNNSDYYLSTEFDGPIWPYGSFGVYFPYSGNKDMNNATQKWGGSANSQAGWMSGSPMHNISTITADYERKNNDSGDSARDYYSWGNYSSTDGRSGGNYAYADTMGAKGWRSVLSDQNKTNEWFISRTGAGDNFKNAGSNGTSYYEPNGNYTGGAWLNFLYDDQGRIRHNDDLDAKYPYYDYMCMAEDNYDFTTRYGLLNGPFKALESTVASGSELSNLDITTKIVKAPLLFDIILLNDSLNAIEPDRDISVGIFLNDTYMVGSTETPKDIHYFGDIRYDGTGAFNSLKTTGRFTLPTSSWPSSTNKWPSASKRLFFKFKYCSINTSEWTDCWNHSGNTATCKAGQADNCKTADSDDFAVRPDRFNFSISGANPHKAGVEYSTTFSAKDLDGDNTLNYTQNVSFLYNETKAGCNEGAFNTTLNTIPFVDGVKVMPLSYSEVGVIHVNLKETVGTEFAIIDADDTSDENRLVTPYDQNWSYTPDHFNVDFNLTHAGNGFTYISSDLNMSAKINLTVTAKNSSDETTINYQTDCYAKNTDYTITYDAPSPSNGLTRLDFNETATSTGNFNDPIGTQLSLNNLAAAQLFTAATPGIANPIIKFNFNKDITIPVSPVLFNITNLNVQDADNVTGFANDDHNITFVYGRTHASKQRYPGNVLPVNIYGGPANIYFETYCFGADCVKSRLPNGITSTNTDDTRWFRNANHNTATDGKVTTVVQKGGINTAADIVTATDNPIGNPSVTTILYDGTKGHPYKTTMQIDASSWLKSIDNEFQVEFDSASGWSGEHETNTTTKNRSGTTTNRRVIW